MRTSVLRGVIRGLFFLCWTLLLVPPYLLIFPLGRKWRRPFVTLWHRGVCFLIALKVNCHGHPYQGKNVLLAGNHISYLDIPVLASCLDITFVAKADVASWPLFGFLARIAQTAFIERTPSKARLQKMQLKKRLKAGERLMIFPEGTSSDSQSVLPFKSSLFDMVNDNDMKAHSVIQPVTLCFKSRDGQKLSLEENDNFAWYGDMTLLPHLWKVFCLSGAQANIIFHAPAMADDFPNRKEMAKWAECRVRNGLETLYLTQEVEEGDQIEQPEILATS